MTDIRKEAEELAEWFDEAIYLVGNKDKAALIRSLLSQLADCQQQLAGIAEVIEAAREYDTAISKMETEHNRPDLYFTQHTTLLPLRRIVRNLGEKP